MGAVSAAMILPTSGISKVLPLATSVLHILTALLLLRRSKFFIARPIQ